MSRRAATGAFLVLIYVFALINLAILLLQSHSVNSAAVDKHMVKLAELIDASQLVTQVQSGSNTAGMLENFRLTGNNRMIRRMETRISEVLQHLLQNSLRKEIERQNYDAIKSEIKGNVSRKLEQQPALMLFSYPVFDELQKDYFVLQQRDLQISLLAAIDEVHNLNFTRIDPVHVASELIRHDTQRRLDWYHEVVSGILIQHRANIAPFTPTELGIPFTAKQSCKFQDPPISRRRLLDNHLEPATLKLTELRMWHRDLLLAIRRLPEPPLELVYGDGIVIGGYGGASLGAALVAVAQLREMRSKLPIQVVIAREEHYDSQICEELLPTMFDALCVVIEREVGVETLDYLRLSKDQFKVFALLFTRFDNTIYLDAKTMALKNVDSLLYLEPYMLTKFVLWPDIWHRTTSPYFYDIAAITPGFPIRRSGAHNQMKWSTYATGTHNSHIAFHDLDNTMPDTTIETGQMVFSKRQHFKSLLLAVYYTMQGPSHYWPLLKQDYEGSQNDDTFLPALHVMQEPYHIVESNSWHTGYSEKRAKTTVFTETAIVLHDPLQSDDFFTEWRKWLVAKKHMDPEISPFQLNEYTRLLRHEFLADHEQVAEIKSTPPKKQEIANHQSKLPDEMFLRPLTFALNPGNLQGTNSREVFKQRRLGVATSQETPLPFDWELQFHSIIAWLSCEGITSAHFWKSHSEKNQTETCKIALGTRQILEESNQNFAPTKGLRLLRV